MPPSKPSTRRLRTRQAPRVLERWLPDSGFALQVEQLEERLQPSIVAVHPFADGLGSKPIADAPALLAEQPETLTIPPAASTTTTLRRELVVIEPDVPDRQSLLRSLEAFSDPGTVLEVVELTGGGVQELTQVILDHPGLDAVHIISHGAEGSLDLGANELDAATMPADAADIRSWARSLNPGADILLYGCRFAGDAAGQSLVGEIHTLTGAETAANTQPTGAAELGGDWALNYATGTIDSRSLDLPSWRHTLGAEPEGSQFQVNTYTNGAQETFPQTPQAVAMNPSTGDYVIAWSSQGQNAGGGWDVYFQRYNAAGVAQGTATLVDTPVNGDNEQYAAVAMNASGNFVVVWAGNQLGHFNIYAQQYNSSGVAQGAAILVDTPAANDQTDPSVAMDSSGDFAVAWQGQLSGNAWGVYAREFNASGAATTGVFQVNDAGSAPQGGGNQPGTSIAMSPSGEFVVTWSGQTGSNQNVYAQVYAAGGTASGSIIELNPTDTTPDSYSSVAMDASGDFVAAWSAQSGSNWNVYEQCFNSSGAALGSPFQVNTSAGDNEYPAVAMDGSGNFVATWSGQNPAVGSSWDVYGQQFFSYGLPDGDPFTVTPYSGYNQEYASVAMSTSGQYVVAWSNNGQDGNNWGVFGQRFVNSGIQVQTASAAPTTNQTGDQTSYQVRLQRTPTANVTISISTSDPTQGSPSVSSLVFTPNDWNVWQTVAITGGSNSPAPYFILNGPAQSSDASFNGLPVQAVSVNAPAGPQVLASAAAVQTTKSGGAATFYVALSSAPLDPVTVALTNTDVSDNLTEGTLSTSSLTFDSTDWNFPQAVTVTGENDHLANGGVYYQITGEATSQDPNYNNVGMNPVTVFNSDTINTPGITVSATSLTTTQAGGSASFTVVLNTEPLNNANVTINLASTEPGQGTLSTSSLNFNNGNWNKPQTVTVKGLADDLPVGATYQIVGTAAASSDAGYDGLTIAPITVVNQPTGPATLVVSKTALQTSKSGGTDSFTVALNTKPSSNVVVTLNTGGSTDGVLSQSTLTFTPLTWNQAQTVTVTGVNDFQATGNQTYQIGGSASSGDAAYNGLSLPAISVTNLDSSHAGFAVLPASLETTKSGGTGTFSVILTSKPASGQTVRLSLSSSDTTQGTPSPSLLTFTALNWNSPQTVTVTGKNNLLTPGAVAYQITGAATSGDSNYNGLTMSPVSMTNINAGNIVVMGTALTTTRAGGAASFKVALSLAPTAPVTLTLANPDPAEGQLSVSTLAFTTTNWMTPQTVTVTGLNDQQVEGAITYQITGTATSAEPAYNNVPMAPVTVTNTGSSNSAGITVTAASPLTTTQGGGSGTFSLCLTCEPTSNVTINFGASDASQGSLSAASVTFTPTNWNTPQTVTFKGLNNGEAQAPSYAITGVASSADSNYNALSINPVAVLNQAGVAAAITVNQTSIQTTGEGGSATFKVSLTTMPAAPVTIHLSSADPSLGAITPSTFVLDASNWNTGQTVTVSANNTQADTGTIAYQITGTASSSDSNYNSAAMPAVTVTDQNNGPAGFTVTPEDNALDTTQAGGQGTFTVVLTSQPTSNVTLALSVSNASEGSLSASSLTFTTSNWNVPQTVVVTGLNDGGVYGSGGVNYTISGTASSSDAQYSNLKLQNIQATNLPINETGIIVTPTVIVTSVTGNQAAFSVCLGSQPGAKTVTVNLTSLAPGEGSLSQSSLVFTSANWNVPQSVVVKGQDDGLGAVGQSYQIAGVATVSSGPAPTTGSPQEGNYNAVAMPLVTVYNAATSLAGVTVSSNNLTTTQSGAIASFTVALTTQPAANVTITLTNPDPSQGALSTTALQFTTSNWNVPQTVTVTGQDNHIASGNQTYQITGAVSSTDPNYNGVAMAPVTVVNQQTDVPGATTSSVFLISEDNTVELVNSLTGAAIATIATSLANDGSVIGPDGSIYVADYYGDVVQHYSPTGQPLDSFPTTGTPQGLAFGPDGNLYVTTTASTVEKYSPSGSPLGIFIAAGSGGLSNAKGIVWDASGNAYVSSFTNSEIIEYNGTTGNPIGVFASGSGGFEELAFGPNHNLYVASYGYGDGDGDVEEFSGTSGALIGLAASGVTNAYGIQFDPAGNLDVSSQSSGTIETFSPNGALLGALASGLPEPAYISSTSILVTSETGTSSQFSVELNTKPLAPVTITLVVSPANGSQASLTFTPSNWNVPQTVTVLGVDNHLSGGETTYQIDGTLSSSDSNYNNTTTSPITVFNENTDTATTAALTSSQGATTYGQSVTFTAVVSDGGGPTPTGSVAFFDGSTQLASVPLNGSGKAVFTTASLGAAGHTIKAVYTPGSHFASCANPTVSQTVQPALLTVTAANAQKVYGASNPTLSAGISGFVLGQSSSVVSGNYTLSTTATKSSGVGGYPIVVGVSGLQAANYTFQAVNGTLTVTPAALTVTANDATRTYGQPNPVFTAGYSGFVNGDNSSVLSGSPSLTTTATPSSAVGNYTITAAQGGLSAANYQFTFVKGTLAVTPATLTVTATGESKVYGQANPTLAYTISGFVNGQPTTIVSGSPTLSTTATTASGVGNYAITVQAGTLSAPNYTLTLVNGLLQVTPATLTVAAQPASKTFGLANPAFDASITGFVNGDTQGVVSGAPALATSATRSSGVGVYPITAGLGTLRAANYVFTYVDNTLTIAPATLTVTADHAFKIVGQANPTLLANITGFVNGDSASVVSGAAVLSTTAGLNSPAGDYPISVTQGALSAANYTFAFANGVLTISPTLPVLTITANDAVKLVGQRNPALTYTITGFVNGDTPAVVSGAPKLTTTATASSGPGVYAITPTLGSLSSSQYTFTFVSGALTVVVPTKVQPPGITASPPAPTTPTPTTTIGTISTASSSLSSGSLLNLTAPSPSGGSSSPGSSTSTTTSGNAGSSTSSTTTLMNESSSSSSDSSGHGKFLLLVHVSEGNDGSGASSSPAGDLRNSAPPKLTPTSPASSRPMAVLSYLDNSADAPISAPPRESSHRTAIALKPSLASANDPDFAPSDSILAQLDRASEGIAANAQEEALTNTLVVSSGIAVAGTALLNTRAVYWFLSALLARPAVWRRFDPLDVIYAWERERVQNGGRSALDSDESLHSMVN
jgi:hypothetical protein